MKIILLFLLLTSCADMTAESIGQPADFSKYREKLNDDLKLAGLPPIDDSKVKFYSYNINEHKIYDGYCSRGLDGSVKISIIRIDSDFSNYVYYIYTHEIGHCLFNKDHTDEPRQIMNKNPKNGSFDDFQNQDLRLQQLKKLFGG